MNLISGKWCMTTRY